MAVWHHSLSDCCRLLVPLPLTLVSRHLTWAFIWSAELSCILFIPGSCSFNAFNFERPNLGVLSCWLPDCLHLFSVLLCVCVTQDFYLFFVSLFFLQSSGWLHLLHMLTSVPRFHPQPWNNSDVWMKTECKPRIVFYSQFTTLQTYKMLKNQEIVPFLVNNRVFLNITAATHHKKVGTGPRLSQWSISCSLKNSL